MIHERIFNRIGSGMLRGLCIAGLVCALGSWHCASAPTTKEAEAAVKDVDDLEEWIEESNLPPEKKAAAKEKAANVKAVVTEQGQALVKKDEQIASLQKYKGYVIGFMVAAGLAIVAGGFLGVRWLIRRASPV